MLACAALLASCGSVPPKPVEPKPEPVPVPPPAPKTITFAAVGDVMMGTDYPDNILPDDDGVGFLAGVAPVLSAADITFGNLEGVLMDGGDAVKRCKPPSKKKDAKREARAIEKETGKSEVPEAPAAPPPPKPTPPTTGTATSGTATSGTATSGTATSTEAETPTATPQAAPTPTSPSTAAPSEAATEDTGAETPRPTAPSEGTGPGAPNTAPAPTSATDTPSTTSAPTSVTSTPSTAPAPTTATSTPSTASTPTSATSTPTTAPAPASANETPGTSTAAPTTSATPAPNGESASAPTTTSPASATTPSTESVSTAPTDTATTIQQPATAGSCYVFRSPTRYAAYLRDAGFDVMSLANNHAQDFGDPGRDSSMRTLDDVGIRHSGRDGDIAEWTTQGRRFALVAFAPNIGSHQLNDLDRARQIVSDLAAHHDIVIVSFHGGSEGEGASTLPFTHELYQGEDRGNVVEFAHTVIDAGADLVIGHGPHVLRAIELYDDRLIAYSLGNFATYYGISVTGIRGIAGILTTRLAEDGRFVDARFDSTIQIRPAGPTLDPEHRAIARLRELTSTAFPGGGLTIEEDGRILRRP